MKCPNKETLLLRLWSMRATSSFRSVGELFPPMNTGLPVASTVLGAGKIPAFTNAVAFGAIMQLGMVLFGNGDPWTMPVGSWPPGQFLAKTLAETSAAVGTLIRVLPKFPP